MNEGTELNKVRKGGNNGSVMQTETGRMRGGLRGSSYLLHLLRLFSLTLSSLHLSDRQLLADRSNPPILRLLPNMLLYFTPSSWKNSEFCPEAVRVKEVLSLSVCPCVTRAVLTSVCNQRLFALLTLLLAVCLCWSCCTVQLYDPAEEPQDNMLVPDLTFNTWDGFWLITCYCVIDEDH